MKIVILAGGKGIRMRPLTNYIPKPLIKINDEPFLYYLLKNIREAGFSEKDIGIVIGYKNEKIKKWLKEQKIKITTILQKFPLGTAHAIKKAEKFVGKNNFIIVMGDNLYSPRDLKRMKKNDNFCYVACTQSAHPENFGVIIKRKNKLKEILEKPKEPPTNLINTGLYKFTLEIFSAIKKIKKNKERNEYEITDAINLLCKEEKVRVLKIKDYWIDFGRLEDLPYVRNFIHKVFNHN